MVDIRGTERMLARGSIKGALRVAARDRRIEADCWDVLDPGGLLGGRGKLAWTRRLRQRANLRVLLRHPAVLARAPGGGCRKAA